MNFEHRDGLIKTIEYFEKELRDSGGIIPTGPGASKPKPKHSSSSTK